MTFAMPAAKASGIISNTATGEVFRKDVAVALAPQVAAIAARESRFGMVQVDKVQVLSPLTAAPAPSNSVTGVFSNLGAVEARVLIYPLNTGECSEVRGIYETFTLALPPVTALFLADFIASYNISSVSLTPATAENQRDLDYCSRSVFSRGFVGTSLALRLGIGLPVAFIFLSIVLFKVYRMVQARRATMTAGGGMQVTQGEPAAGGLGNFNAPPPPPSYPVTAAAGADPSCTGFNTPAMGYPSAYPSAYPPVPGEYAVPGAGATGYTPAPGTSYYPQASGGYGYGQSNNTGAEGGYTGGFTYSTSSAQQADGRAAANSPGVTVSAGPVLYSKYNK
jgi:hypothetical protein